MKLRAKSTSTSKQVGAVAAFWCLLWLLGASGCLPLPAEAPAPPPEPVAVPAPIVAPSGFHVLLWRETNLDRVPEWQLQLIFGDRFAAWAKAHKVDYRFWDPQIVATSRESADWRRAATRKPPKVPWLVIQRDAKAWEGPPPAGVEDVISFLETFEQ